MAQAVANARALIPRLRERAPRQEAARSLLPETLSDLQQHGLFRFLQPKRYGGMELDFIALIDITTELAKGCASTAWNVGNLAIHNWFLCQFDPRAQDHVWGADPNALIAGGIAYPQGRATRVEGGYQISGYWNFSSGVDPSEFNQLAVTVRDGDNIIGYRMCVLHKSQYQIVDDWHVLGMRGTGSKSVKATDVFVPEHLALDTTLVRGGLDFPGAAANPNPMYRIGLTTMGTHCLVGAALGNAAGALELTIESVKARSTNYTGQKMRDFQAIQLRVATAGAQIDAATLLARDDVLVAQQAAVEGRMLSDEHKLRIKRNVAYCVQLCTQAVDSLHGLAGANGIYDNYPIQRMFRDAHALAGHFGFAFDMHGSTWGVVAMGGEYVNPLL